MQTDSPDTRHARLRWRCRRGLLELDLWLRAFAEHRLHTLSADECIVLERLLHEPDLKLMDWLQSRSSVPDEYMRIVENIRNAV